MKLRNRRSIKGFLVVFVGLSSIAAFAVVSGVVNAQPSTDTFQGWVTILQPSSDIESNQVQLRLRSVSSGAPGQNPVLEYSALVCGDKPFRGIMLIGGDARVSKALIRSPEGMVTAQAGSPDHPALIDIPDLVLSDTLGNSWNLGPVQLVDLTIDAFVSHSACRLLTEESCCLQALQPYVVSPRVPAFPKHGRYEMYQVGMVGRFNEQA